MFSTLKKAIVLVIVTLFLSYGTVCAETAGFENDSTGTPSGTAKQPDINQRGSNIIEVGNLETSSIDADSATVTGVMSAGSVSTSGAVSASSVSTSGAVSAGTVSAPNGAITNLNTNRTYVQRTPTSQVDATNKKYVDTQDSTLSTRISALESSSGGGISQKSSYHSSQWRNNLSTWTITGLTSYQPLIITLEHTNSNNLGYGYFNCKRGTTMHPQVPISLNTGTNYSATLIPTSSTVTLLLKNLVNSRLRAFQ